jgi:hypothetical protein
MKIKKLTQQSCDDLLKNISVNFSAVKHSYHKHNYIDFHSLTDGLNVIESTAYEVSDEFINSYNQFKLELDENGSKDFDNARFIYEAFPGLTPSDANDERLWIRLTHDHCHSYMVKRWMSGGEKTQETIIDRFFFKGRGQRTRVHNGISRLWWIAKLTVQEDANDVEEKWKYTKIICESQDFITSILERTMGTYPNVRFAILDYYLDNKAAFGEAKSKKIQKLLRDLNNYGGVNLLPLMGKEQVTDLIKKII